MSSLKSVSKRLVLLEDQLNERLSIWLFGDQIDEDYKDIALPSEDRKEEKEKVKKKRKRRGIQLQLLLLKGVKRGLLAAIEGVELGVSFIRASRPAQVERGNTYM